MIAFLCIVAVVIGFLGLCVSGAVKRQEQDNIINQMRGERRQWTAKKELM